MEGKKEKGRKERREGRREGRKGSKVKSLLSTQPLAPVRLLGKHKIQGMSSRSPERSAAFPRHY